MGVLVIGFHSHCNDCDTMTVMETEARGIQQIYIQPYLSSHSGKADGGDRTFGSYASSTFSSLTLLSHHIQHPSAVYVLPHS